MSSRRTFFLAIGAGISFCNFGWSATPFWNKKPSTAWSPEEIQQLTTRSPWARETNLDFEAVEGGHFELPGTGSPYGGADGTGRGSTIPRPSGVMKKAPVLVRWESAQPIRDALLVPLSREFEGHYMLGVSNVPLEAMNPPKRGGGEEQTVSLSHFLDELQAAATLEAPGKEPVGAGLVRGLKGVEATYLFGFSKELLPLSVSDREVQFTLRTARVSVKAKFVPREMTYRGQLAL
jgi:hypothetical protein